MARYRAGLPQVGDGSAKQYEQLRASLPAISVLGGCCGTDLRHVEQIAAACVRPG